MAPPAPLISQYDDINPEQFCNGDNRPANCGQNCMCTHKVDIPLNAVVEVVLVDEGMYIPTSQLITRGNWFIQRVIIKINPLRYKQWLDQIEPYLPMLSSRKSIYFFGNYTKLNTITGSYASCIDYGNYRCKFLIVLSIFQFKSQTYLTRSTCTDTPTTSSVSAARPTRT